MDGFPLFQQVLLVKLDSLTHMIVAKDNAQTSPGRISAEIRELAGGPRS